MGKIEGWVGGSQSSDLFTNVSYDTSVKATESGFPLQLQSSIEIESPYYQSILDFKGAILTVALSGGNSQDQFWAYDSPPLVFGNEIGADDNGFRLLEPEGNAFANFMEQDGRLTITFTSSETTATWELVNDTLQTITYSSHAGFNDGTLSFSWTFVDGGGQGTTASTNLTLIDDCPEDSNVIGIDDNVVPCPLTIDYTSGLMLPEPDSGPGTVTAMEGYDWPGM